VVLFPGFKETDHSTHVLERGIVGIGGIPVVRSRRNRGCCAIIFLYRPTQREARVNTTTKLALNKLAK
jgi:hypothetical protein